MSDLVKSLRESFRDPDYAEIYSDSFLDMYLASQIKVLREQRGLSQKEMGERIGTTQGGVSRIEDAEYSGWSVKTLKKIASALRVRLRISMEEFGTLPDQVVSMSQQSLMRAAHENDPALFPEKFEAAHNVAPINSTAQNVAGTFNWTPTLTVPVTSISGKHLGSMAKSSQVFEREIAS